MPLPILTAFAWLACFDSLGRAHEPAIAAWVITHPREMGALQDLIRTPNERAALRTAIEALRNAAKRGYYQEDKMAVMQQDNL